MLAKAHYLLAELGAELLATGDVVGQRVRSAIRDFEVVDYHAGLEGRVLRPLSARLLSETHAEQQGWVDREQLLDWQGKSRRLQERLAERLGVPLVPPRPDCPLLTGSLAKRALSLLRSPLPLTAWELELLPIGRHVWLDHAAYVVIGRNEEQNERLASAATDPVALPTIRITPVNFPGPTALLIGRVSEGSVQRVCELVTRYSRHVPPEQRLRIEFLLNRAKSP